MPLKTETNFIILFSMDSCYKPRLFEEPDDRCTAIDDQTEKFCTLNNNINRLLGSATRIDKL